MAGADLAELSIKIDSKTAVSGAAALENLEKKAARSEAASTRLERAFAGVSRQMNVLTKEAAQTNVILRSTAAMIGNQATAAQRAAAAERGLATEVQKVTSGISAYLGKTQAATTQTQRLGASVQQAGAQAKTASGGFFDLGSQMKMMLTTMAAGGALFGLGAGLKSAGRESLEFATNMARVSTLFDESEMSRMGVYSDKIRAIGIQFGRLPKDQAMAFYEIIAAGAEDSAQAMDILSVANQLAIGGVTDVDTAASALTTVLASYAGQVKNATEAADAMFISAATGKTDIDQLARFIGKVAPVAGQLGVNFDELSAAAGVLTRNGQKTQIAMQGLRGILISVLNPTIEAKRLAAELGIEYNHIALKNKGLTTFLRDVWEGIGQNEAILAKLLGTTEAILPAMTLLSEEGMRVMDETMEEMANKAGRTETAFNKMASTPQFKIDQLKTKLNDLKISIGDDIIAGMMPGIEGLVANFDTTARVIGNLAKALAVLMAMKAGGWIQGWVAGLIQKANAARQERAATVQATLEQAKYTRATNESTQAALRNALAHVRNQQQAIRGAMVMRSLTVAQAKQYLADFRAAEAKIKLTMATAGATSATRAFSSVMGFLGGPVGIAIMAISGIAMIMGSYSAKAEAARQKTMEWARQTGMAADGSVTLVQQLREEFAVLNDAKSTTEQSKDATANLAIAKSKLMALGPEYREAIAKETDSYEGLLEAIQKVNQAKLIEFDEKITDVKKRMEEVQPDFLTGQGENTVQGQVTMGAFRSMMSPEVLAKQEAAQAEREANKASAIAANLAEKRAPLEEELNTLLSERARLQESILKINQDQTPDRPGKKKPTNTDSPGDPEEEARQRMLASLEEWVRRLEEEARTLGLTREEALKLSEEYNSLSESQRMRADAALGSIEQAKEQAEADKRAVEEAKRYQQHLESLMRTFAEDPRADDFAAAQRTLNRAWAEGTITAREYAAMTEKARLAFTAQGQAEVAFAKELNQLDNQLSVDDEYTHRLEMVNLLYRQGRIDAEAYRNEVVRLQTQMSEGFATAMDITNIAVRNLEDTFVDFATTGEFNFNKMINAMIQDIIRLLTHKALVKLVDLMIDVGLSSASPGQGAGGVGSLAGGISASFVGGRASGGSLHRGQMALVGETGPDLFVPSSNGTVIPNGGFGSQASIPITVNVFQDGSSEVKVGDGKAETMQMAKKLGNAIRKTVSEETRPGGIIYDFVKRS